MRTFDLDALRTFLACASAPSFADAGGRVHKSQSTVSAQMRKLEETVGRPLFVKRGRRNHLTAAGEELGNYAERLLRLNDEAIGRFAPAAFQGRLRIGTPDDYAEAFLPRVFGRFAARHPTVEVAIECRSSQELVDMLGAGTLDVALVTLDPKMVDAEWLHHEPLRWMSAPDSRRELDRPLPLAVWQPGCLWRTAALAALDAAGTDYRIAYTGSNATALTTTVRAGLAVAALPARFMGQGLRTVEADAGLPDPGGFDVAMMRSGLAPRHLVDAFTEELRAAFEAFDATARAAA